MRLSRCFVLSAFLVSATASAAVFVVPSDDELIEEARFIAVGTVVDVTPRLNRHGVIATDVSLLVTSPLKRARANEIVHVMQPGGVLSPHALVVSGSASYEKGERVLLFADEDGDGNLTTWGLSLGKFKLMSEGGRSPVFVREVQTGSLYLTPGGEVAGFEQPRRMAAFLRFVRAVLDGENADRDYLAEPRPLLPSREIGVSSLPSTDRTLASTEVVAAASAYPASAYVMNNFRWELFDKGGTATFYVGSRQPGYDDLGAAQRGLAAWTNDPNSNVNYRYGGTGGGAFVEDGVNSIVYNAATGVPAGALAYSQAYAGDPHPFNGESFWTIIEGDIIVKSNPGVTQTVFDEAVTHELGHTLGFRHANEGTPSSSDAVMVSVLTGHWGATLSPWDKEAVNAVYPSTTAPPPPANGSGVKGDFNGDGQADVVLRNRTTGATAVWLLNSSLAVVGTLDLPALTNTAYKLSGTADFNADGWTDILWRNQSTGQTAIWLMNGKSITRVVDLPAIANTAYEIQATGDFNGDGRPDIVWRNQSTGQNALWLMSATQTVSGVVDLPALPNTSFRIQGAGDFNGDGRVDIVWRNYATGQNAAWLMNGVSFAGILDLPALTNTAFKIGGVADFDRNGRADIVWRNQSTGQNAIWLMSGASLLRIVDLPALTNLAYEIVGPR
jgi:hypothetical protein